MNKSKSTEWCVYTLSTRWIALISAILSKQIEERYDIFCSNKKINESKWDIWLM